MYSRPRPSALVPVIVSTVEPRDAGVDPLVMKILDPFITHSSPSFTAFVFVPPASLPASGSVKPKPQTSSPVVSFGR